MVGVVLAQRVITVSKRPNQLKSFHPGNHGRARALMRAAGKSLYLLLNRLGETMWTMNGACVRWWRSFSTHTEGYALTCTESL